MKTTPWKIALLMLAICLMSCGNDKSKTPQDPVNEPTENTENIEKLRHVVLFSFKDSTATADIRKVEKAFASLPALIPEIQDFEWGTNNSPEGLDKGFTHSFLVTFASEEDREVYLPHPDHQAFVELLQPHLEDVLVIDYWAR